MNTPLVAAYVYSTLEYVDSIHLEDSSSTEASSRTLSIVQGSVFKTQSHQTRNIKLRMHSASGFPSDYSSDMNSMGLVIDVEIVFRNSSDN